jgi:hypothetical protein
VRLSNIIPPLLNILQNADFKTKKEACWAISNATSGGLQEPNQIRYLVTQGCIKPMCDLLNSMDNKIIQVALDGLENILKVGEIDKEADRAQSTNMRNLSRRRAAWCQSTTYSTTKTWRSTRSVSTSWTVSRLLDYFTSY